MSRQKTGKCLRQPIDCGAIESRSELNIAIEEALAGIRCELRRLKSEGFVDVLQPIENQSMQVTPSKKAAPNARTFVRAKYRDLKPKTRAPPRIE